ncbi:MAG TPA: hypothetical protein VGF16_04885 [Bryobacteraceae bacterium]|jgi:hypothetical protein
MNPRLYGPFQLTQQAIDAHLQADSPGVYALGSIRNNLFIVSYIGRADADLKAGLKGHVPGPYPQFKFTYAVSARDAFLKECEIYHEYIGLDNRRHPCPPRETDLRCPRCKRNRAELKD